MAGNQEPMLRHIKRSTGGRSQSSGADSETRRVHAYGISRKIASSSGFIYLYRSMPYFAVPPTG